MEREMMYRVVSKHKFLIASKDHQNYQFVDNIESKCIQSSERLICGGLRFWYTNEKPTCEWNLFNHRSRNGCALEMVENGNFIFGLESNRFIFSCHQKIDASVICKNSVFNQKLEGEGILNLSPRCDLRNGQFKLESGIEFENASSIIIPTFEIHNKTGWTGEAGVNQSSFSVSDLSAIGDMLNKTRDNLSIAKFNNHDVHHYTAIYLCLGSIVVLFILYLRRISWRDLLSAPHIILPAAENVGDQHQT